MIEGQRLTYFGPLVQKNKFLRFSKHLRQMGTELSHDFLTEPPSRTFFTSEQLDP